MAQLTREQLHNYLDKKKIFPVYLVYGEETYLIDKTLDILKEKILQDGLSDLNLDSFYGQSTDMGQIVDAIEQLPMMAPRRMVIIRELQDIRDQELERLLERLENPIDTTVVVLVASQIDKRRKTYKKLLSLNDVVSAEYRRPYENEIPRWIEQIAKKYGIRLSMDVRNLFHQLVGNNLNEIEAEIRKLSQYIGDKKTVYLEDVNRVVSRSRIESVFDLANAIGESQQEKAFVCLGNLIENGQSELGILALVARHVRILSEVKEGQAQRKPDKILSSELKISPYFLKDYIRQSKKWSKKKLERVVEDLCKTDQALKSSSLPARMYLESFLLKTCRI